MFFKKKILDYVIPYLKWLLVFHLFKVWRFHLYYLLSKFLINFAVLNDIPYVFYLIPLLIFLWFQIIRQCTQKVIIPNFYSNLLHLFVWKKQSKFLHLDIPFIFNYFFIFILSNIKLFFQFELYLSLDTLGFI